MSALAIESLHEIHCNSVVAANKRDFNTKNYNIDNIPSFALSIGYKPTMVFSLNEILRSENLLNYKPKTELGKKLWELKLKYIISGGKLFKDNEIE